MIMKATSTVLLRKSRIKTVNVTEKVKVFLESVTKTLHYVTCTPLNSNVESLTLPLKHIMTGHLFLPQDCMNDDSLFTKVIYSLKGMQDIICKNF